MKFGQKNQERVGPSETVEDWWNWTINLSCNKSQLQRVSSTIAGTTIRERRLAFFGKSHFFSHGRGKDFSEEEEVAVTGPVNEKLRKNARNRSLIDEHWRSRFISWKKKR